MLSSTQHLEWVWLQPIGFFKHTLPSSLSKLHWKEKDYLCTQHINSFSLISGAFSYNFTIWIYTVQLIYECTRKHINQKLETVTIAYSDTRGQCVSILWDRISYEFIQCDLYGNIWFLEEEKIRMKVPPLNVTVSGAVNKKCLGLIKGNMTQIKPGLNVHTRHLNCADHKYTLIYIFSNKILN